jgi:hypothetical protein
MRISPGGSVTRDIDVVEVLAKKSGVVKVLYSFTTYETEARGS